MLSPRLLVGVLSATSRNLLCNGLLMYYFKNIYFSRKHKIKEQTSSHVLRATFSPWQPSLLRKLAFHQGISSLKAWIQRLAK